MNNRHSQSYSGVITDGSTSVTPDDDTQPTAFSSFKPEDELDDIDRPLQFGLSTLLIVVAVCCVALGLFQLLGVYGGVVCMLVATAFTWLVQSRYSSFRSEGMRLVRTPPKWRRVLELIWGVGMPLVAMLFDPGVIRGNAAFLALATAIPAPWSELPSGSFVQIYPWTMYCYFFVALEISLLCIAMFRPAAPVNALPLQLTQRCRGSALLSGALHLGGGMAIIAAVLLTPFAALAVLLFGIGLMYFTPWAACAVYTSRGRELSAEAALRLTETEHHILQIAGAAAVTAATLVCGFALSAIAEVIAP